MPMAKGNYLLVEEESKMFSAYIPDIVNAPCIARNSRLWFHKDPKEIAVRAADAELVLATRCDLEIDGVHVRFWTCWKSPGGFGIRPRQRLYAAPRCSSLFGQVQTPSTT